MLEPIMLIALGLVLTWEFVTLKQHRRREEECQVECDQLLKENARMLREILRVVTAPRKR